MSDEYPVTRRAFLATPVVLGAVSTAAAVHAAPAGNAAIKLRVNGQVHSVSVEPRVTLLDVLRERAFRYAFMLDAVGMADR